MATPSSQPSGSSSCLSQTPWLPPAAEICWMPKGNSTKAFCFHGNVIALETWENTLKCQNLIAEATSIMHKKLLFDKELPEVDVKSIFDDLSENAQNHSFVEDRKNRATLSRCVKFSNMLPNIGPSQLLEYLTSVHEFPNILQIIILYSGGVAPSTQDMVGAHLLNGELGLHSPLRSVRVHEGSLWLLTMTSDHDLVLRRLPSEVGLLLLFYLTIVRPYFVRKNSTLDDSSIGEFIVLTSPYLFPGEEYDALVRKQTLKDLNVEMSYMEWREVFLLVERSLRPTTIDDRGLDPTNTELRAPLAVSLADEIRKGSWGSDPSWRLILTEEGPEVVLW